MKWEIKAFQDLTTSELFQIYKARVEVFVVEQECPYQEVDEADLKAFHIFSQDQDGNIVAYARVIPQENSVRVGRVLVKKELRKEGLGRLLLQRVLTFARSTYEQTKIEIQAQAYLQKFYEKHGFQVVSQVYLEDNIPHIDMVLNWEN